MDIENNDLNFRLNFEAFHIVLVYLHDINAWLTDSQLELQEIQDWDWSTFLQKSPIALAKTSL